MGTTEQVPTTENPHHEYEMSFAFSVLFSVIGFVVVGLNLVCAVAIFRGKLHREENRFLFMASLAVADALFGGAVILSTSVVPGLESVDACIARNLMVEITLTAVVLCLSLLTADQFVRIELHMKYPLCATFRNGCLALFGVFALCSAHALIAGCLRYHHAADGDCLYFESFPAGFHVYNMVVYFFAPLLMIVGMHTRIFYISWKHMKTLSTLAPTVQHKGNGHCHGGQHCKTDYRGGKAAAKGSDQEVCPCGHNNKLQARRQWRAVVTISVLVGVLLCTWAPGNVVVSIVTLRPEFLAESRLWHKLIDYTSTLYFINPLVNPFIYIVRVPEVRKEIKKLFKCPWISAKD